MGQALYRKYRSRNLSEIVGQDHITKTLEQALKQGHISHAYLLTGPRGVGKTSIARILAHEINSLPYKDDSSHMDIIEIDAASNRRIDEIRELRDKVYIAPTEAKYKVYIIDEVHMLTKEAFNALLKTLEEPPAHVVFILATTDAHKLPETIVSRTQRYSFKPVSKDEVVDHLAEIAKKEKITVSTEALELLAEHGEGSFRDSISMLDQASSHGGKLDVGDIQQLLGIPPSDSIRKLLDSLARGASSADLVTSLNDLYEQGYQPAAIAKQLSQAIRGQLIGDQSALGYGQALELLDSLIKVPASHDPERFLEIVILMRSRPTAQQPDVHVQTETEDKSVTAVQADVPKSAKKYSAPEGNDKPSAKKSAKHQKIDASIWPEVLGALKQKHNTLYSVVRMAQPKFLEDNTLQLVFGFPFHKKRLNESTNRQLLNDTIQELTGQSVTIECVLDETSPPPVNLPPADNSQPPEELTAISNIFGGGELLES